MSRCMLCVVFAACLISSSGAARADTTIETHGIELDLPAGWAEIKKGPVTVLVPKKSKGRGLEVRSLPAMPAATAEALGKVLGSQLQITSAKEVQRQGVRVVQVEGKLVIKKAGFDLDLIVVPVKSGATVIASVLPVDQDALLRDAYRKVLLTTRVAGPKMSVSLAPPTTKGVVGAPRAFVDGITRVVAGFDAVYRFPGPLPVKFTECHGDPNAYYSKPEHAIIICHEFFDFFTKLFTKVGVKPEQLPELVSDTMLFFFLHEFGHAMVGELELPITGKGEDAADEIATLLLIQAPKPIGTKAALAGARAFYSMTKVGMRSTFWDTHSFNDQRMAEVACLLYGAEPKTYEPMMKQLGATSERMRKCPGQYKERARAWNRHLAPHMRRKAPRK